MSVFDFFKKDKSPKDFKVGKSNGQGQNAEMIRKDALAKAAAAKDNLGNETIQKIAGPMKDMDKRKAQIKAAQDHLQAEANAESLALEILEMMKTKT